MCSLDTPRIAGNCGEIASIWERLSDFAPSKPPKKMSGSAERLRRSGASERLCSLKTPQIAWSAERLQRSGSVRVIVLSQNPRNCRDCGWRDCVDLGASERFCSLNPPPTCLECGEIATIWERLSDFAHQILPVTKIKCVTSTNKWKGEGKKEGRRREPPKGGGKGEHLRRSGSI